MRSTGPVCAPLPKARSARAIGINRPVRCIECLISSASCPGESFSSESSSRKSWEKLQLSRRIQPCAPSWVSTPEPVRSQNHDENLGAGGQRLHGACGMKWCRLQRGSGLSYHPFGLTPQPGRRCSGVSFGSSASSDLLIDRRIDDWLLPPAAASTRWNSQNRRMACSTTPYC